jgi:hypothetical protein
MQQIPFLLPDGKLGVVQLGGFRSLNSCHQ